MISQKEDFLQIQRRGAAIAIAAKASIREPLDHGTLSTLATLSEYDAYFLTKHFELLGQTIALAGQEMHTTEIVEQLWEIGKLGKFSLDMLTGPAKELRQDNMFVLGDELFHVVNPSRSSRRGLSLSY